jgi:hypothetical protein
VCSVVELLRVVGWADPGEAGMRHERYSPSQCNGEHNGAIRIGCLFKEGRKVPEVPPSVLKILLVYCVARVFRAKPEVSIAQPSLIDRTSGQRGSAGLIGKDEKHQVIVPRKQRSTAKDECRQRTVTRVKAAVRQAAVDSIPRLVCLVRPSVVSFPAPLFVLNSVEDVKPFLIAWRVQELVGLVGMNCEMHSSATHASIILLGLTADNFSGYKRDTRVVHVRHGSMGRGRRLSQRCAGKSCRFVRRSAVGRGVVIHET